ncbi:MAG: hypothetical protein JWQ35_1255 [Bacteriovoracaceae bacterium]|nr:hypothetical protein [Bacteriovoracaceae bacterium]
MKAFLFLTLIVNLGRLEAVELNCQPPTPSLSSDIIRSAEEQSKRIQLENKFQEDLEKLISQNLRFNLMPWIVENLQRYKSLTASKKENFKNKLFLLSRDSKYSDQQRAVASLILLKIYPSFLDASFIPSLSGDHLTDIAEIAGGAKISLSETVVLQMFDRLSDLAQGDFFYRQLNKYGKLGTKTRGLTRGHIRTPDQMAPFGILELFQISVSGDKRKLIRKALNSKLETIQSVGLSFSWELEDEAEPYILSAIKKGDAGAEVGESIAKMDHPSAKLIGELSKSKGLAVDFFLVALCSHEPTTTRISIVKQFLNGPESLYANIQIVEWAVRWTDPKLKELATEALQLPDVLDYFLRREDLEELEYIFPLLKDEEAKNEVKKHIQGELGRRK